VAETLRERATQARQATATEREQAWLEGVRALLGRAREAYGEVTASAAPAASEWSHIDRNVVSVTVEGITFEYRNDDADEARAVWVTDVDGVRIPHGTGRVTNLEELGEVIDRATSRPPATRPEALP
jgi:hypothetical protein